MHIYIHTNIVKSRILRWIVGIDLSLIQDLDGWHPGPAISAWPAGKCSIYRWCSHFYNLHLWWRFSTFDYQKVPWLLDYFLIISNDRGELPQALMYPLPDDLPRAILPEVSCDMLLLFVGDCSWDVGMCQDHSGSIPSTQLTTWHFWRTPEMELTDCDRNNIQYRRHTRYLLKKNMLVCPTIKGTKVPHDIMFHDNASYFLL